MYDIENEKIKIYSKEDLETAFDYITYLDKETRDDFLFYIIFTPYEDFILEVMDTLIKKYPLEGYEIKKAAHYLDSNPKKTLEICEKMKGKYKGNERLLEEIKHLEEWISKKGDN